MSALDIQKIMHSCTSWLAALMAASERRGAWRPLPGVCSCTNVEKYYYSYFGKLRWTSILVFLFYVNHMSHFICVNHKYISMMLNNLTYKPFSYLMMAWLYDAIALARHYTSNNSNLRGLLYVIHGWTPPYFW